jgi:hypothetical protein
MNELLITFITDSQPQKRGGFRYTKQYKYISQHKNPEIIAVQINTNQSTDYRIYLGLTE